MLKFRNAAIGFGLLAASTLGAGAAVAAPTHGFVTVSGLNLRAGPGTDYPVVVTMRGGDRVTIYGCLSGWSWCDIDWYGNRGWAAGQYLQVTYQGYRRPIMSYGYRVEVPFLSFGIGPYWRDHYQHRQFFNDMRRYEGSYSGPTPPFGKPPYVKPPYGKPPHMGSPTYQLPPKGSYENKGFMPPTGSPPHPKQYPGQLQNQGSYLGQDNGSGPIVPKHPKGPPQGGGGYNGQQNGTPPQCLPGQHFVNGQCQ